MAKKSRSRKAADRGTTGSATLRDRIAVEEALSSFLAREAAAGRRVSRQDLSRVHAELEAAARRTSGRRNRR
jgi:hypothetical protein